MNTFFADIYIPIDMELNVFVHTIFLIHYITGTLQR